MEIKEGLKYSESHEWIQIEGNNARVGITDYAQEALGDIVYVELPKVGSVVKKGEEVLSIESVKVAEAVYAPVSGTINAINLSLSDNPENLNKDSFTHFLYTMSLSQPDELDSLMDAAAYKIFIDGQ